MFRQKGKKKKREKLRCIAVFYKCIQKLWPHVLGLIIFLKTNINSKLDLRFRPDVHSASCKNAQRSRASVTQGQVLTDKGEEKMLTYRLTNI